MRQLLERIGATVEWNSETSTAYGQLNDNKVEFITDSNTYIVNGETKTMDVKVFIQDGNTYVPVRFAVEALGLTVDWDEDTKTIIIE